MEHVDGNGGGGQEDKAKVAELYELLNLEEVCCESYPPESVLIPGRG